MARPACSSACSNACGTALWHRRNENRKFILLYFVEDHSSGLAGGDEEIRSIYPSRLYGGLHIAFTRRCCHADRVLIKHRGFCADSFVNENVLYHRDIRLPAPNTTAPYGVCICLMPRTLTPLSVVSRSPFVHMQFFACIHKDIWRPRLG